MGSPDSSVSPATASSRGSRRYEAWLSGHLDLQPGAAEGTRVFACPSAEAAEEIRHARARGATRIIVNFLPDEIEAPGSLWMQEIRFWHAWVDFVPFILPSVETQAGPREVVLITEDNDRPEDFSTRVLAESWATAHGMNWREIRLDEHDDPQLAQAIAGAAVVVHDVRDWSYGFAIDVAAALTGARVVRMEQPGYSPVRYGMVGQRLALAPSAEVIRLRPAITAAIEDRSEEIRDWLIASDACQRWRRLLAEPAAINFWNGVDWSQIRRGPHERAGDWFNRAAAWPVLAAAASSAEFPRAAAAHASGTMTAWLTGVLREHPGSWTREHGLARWLVRQPRWAEEFRAAGGENRDGREALIRWGTRALDLVPAGGAALPAVKACGWAIKDDSDEAKTLSFVLRWLSPWSSPRDRGTTGDMVAASVRAASVEACWEGLETHAIPSVLESIPSLADAELWWKSFGAAGPWLRGVAAWHAKRPAMVRAVWQDLVKSAGLVCRGGLARLVRPLVQRREDAVSWLRGVAQMPAESLRTTVLALLNAWLAARSGELWRRHHTALMQQELGIAIAVANALVASSPPPRGAHVVRALLLSLRGAAADAVAAIDGTPRPVAALATLGALALWLREQPAAARSLIEHWRLGPDEPLPGLFLRACAAQLLGMHQVVAPLLNQLARRAPGYLVESDVADARWGWAALVMRRAGRAVEAERLAARARARSRMADEFFDQVEPGADPLDAGWQRLMS